MSGSSHRGNSILHNSAVLYTVFAIALVNLLSYVMVGDIRHSIVFLLTGFVVSFLSKNMVVILCIAMAVTNIVKVAMGSREGMEDGAAAAEEKEKEEKEGMEDSAEETPNEEAPNKKEDAKDKKENMDETMATIKKDGNELLKVQDKIIDGFNQIEPYMKQAEKLANKIDNTANTLQNM